MSYLPNFIPLDENGGSDGRNKHTVIRDKLIHDWFEEGFDDDTIYIAEKPYWYTVENITPEEAHLVGEHHGDFDVAEYNVEEDHLWLAEIKGTKEVPANMPEEEAREKYEAIDHAHDQLADAISAIENINMNYGLDITVETEVIVWSDVFEEHRFNSSTLPSYTGSHYCTTPAYEKAQQSEAFCALVEANFDGKLLEGGERIRKR